MAHQIINKLLLSGIFALSLSACYYDKADKIYPADPNQVCDTANTKYTLTIAPILKTNCTDKGCHTTGKQDANIVLDNYSGTKACVDGGRLIGSLKGSVGYSSMPKGYPLISTCDVAKIQNWIDKGAPNN